MLERSILIAAVVGGAVAVADTRVTKTGAKPKPNPDAGAVYRRGMFDDLFTLEGKKPDAGPRVASAVVRDAGTSNLTRDPLRDSAPGTLYGPSVDVPQTPDIPERPAPSSTPPERQPPTTPPSPGPP